MSVHDSNSPLARGVSQRKERENVRDKKVFTANNSPSHWEGVPGSTRRGKGALCAARNMRATTPRLFRRTPSWEEGDLAAIK